MAEMTHEYSQFPEKLFERTYYKDVDDSVADLINQIKELNEQGLVNQVNRIVEQNADALANRVISAEAFNALSEEVVNIEIYAKQVQQSIHVQDEEPDAVLGDVWIGD